MVTVSDIRGAECPPNSAQARFPKTPGHNIKDQGQPKAKTVKVKQNILKTGSPWLSEPAGELHAQSKYPD